MIRVLGLILLALLGCTILIGCSRTTTSAPLTPEQERELEEQLEKASHAEGASETDKNN